MYLNVSFRNLCFVKAMVADRKLALSSDGTFYVVDIKSRAITTRGSNCTVKLIFQSGTFLDLSLVYMIVEKLLKFLKKSLLQSALRMVKNTLICVLRKAFLALESFNNDLRYTNLYSQNTLKPSERYHHFSLHPPKKKNTKFGFILIKLFQDPFWLQKFELTTDTDLDLDIKVFIRIKLYS